MKRNRIVILDNGHGIETPGKRSPDGCFREYKWCREFVQRLKRELQYWDYIVYDIISEETDLGLTKRANLVNTICDRFGVGNCIFISIHNNAAGDGSRWFNATGWEAYTSPGCTKSDRLAELMYQEAELKGLRLRKDMSDGDSDKEANFTVLMKTKCPAVLTENMFMDSKNDVEYLQSEEGINTLIEVHLNAIRRYFEDYDGTHDTWMSSKIH